MKGSQLEHTFQEYLLMLYDWKSFSVKFGNLLFILCVELFKTYKKYHIMFNNTILIHPLRTLATNSPRSMVQGFGSTSLPLGTLGSSEITPEKCISLCLLAYFFSISMTPSIPISLRLSHNEVRYSICMLRTLGKRSPPVFENAC